MPCLCSFTKNILTIPNGQSEVANNDSQYNDLVKKGKRTNDGLQHITQKAKDPAARTTL